MTEPIKLPPLPEGWETELLDWVSACQSAYHIDNTPGHRFGGLGSNLEENRSEIICFVRGLIESHATAAIEADRQARGEPVLFQSRTRPVWVGASKNWTAWENCTKDQADDYRRAKVINDWEYEVRELYTAPQPAEPVKVDGKASVPSDEAIQALAKQYDCHLQGFMGFARALLARYVQPAEPNVLPGEAVFGFSAWLTSLKTPVTFSECNGAAIGADLAAAYNKSQGFDEIREDFHKRLKPYPEQEPAQPAEPVACFKCGHSKHGGECVNVAPQPQQQASGLTPPSSALGPIKIGNLPTMNQDDYPDLGDWWVQLRIGPDNDEVLARVYGDTPQQAYERAILLAKPHPQQIPPERPYPDTYFAAWHEAKGWNDCRRAMLEAAPQPQQIPEGYKRVPIKSTREMQRAGAQAARKYMQETGGNNPAVIYEAMLEAAPKVKPEQPKAQPTDSEHHARNTATDL